MLKVGQRISETVISTHFEARSQTISMEEDGVITLNGEEAVIVCSLTVDELTSSLHRFTR